MRFRVQRTVHRFWRERYVVCLQARTDGPWQCHEVSRRQLDGRLSQLGFAHHRDADEIFAEIDFAERDHGVGGGCVELHLDKVRQRLERRAGDPRPDRSQ